MGLGFFLEVTEMLQDIKSIPRSHYTVGQRSPLLLNLISNDALLRNEASYQMGYHGDQKTDTI